MEEREEAGYRSPPWSILRALQKTNKAKRLEGKAVKSAFKAHRGEPANEGANTLADKAVSDPKVGKEWCKRTNRAVFMWKKPTTSMENIGEQVYV